MEEQHPIPQQISSYQFRLVGDMTLKQFFQVAGGALVALIIYSSGLPSYVRWPLIIFSFLFGVALAFFPLEDRPLETWIFAFIKTIYSPTVYIWKKLEKKPSFFQPEPTIGAEKAVPTEVQVVTQTATVTNLQEPVVTVPALEKGEQEFLNKVSEHFNAPSTPAPALIPTAPLRKKIEVIESKPVRVERGVEKPGGVGRKPSPPLPDSDTTYFAPSVGQKTEGALSAMFSPDAAPPIPPSKPNIIVGQVVDSQGKIVENAILEIKDEDGRSVRALKSNKLGHFMIVTPLSNGKYEIITEAEGLNFNPVALIVKGDVVPPIAIWSRKAK